MNYPRVEMDARISMVKLAAKTLGVQEVTVVGLSIFYNSGKYFRKDLDREELEEEYARYLRDVVSPELEWFCLDLLAGRIPENKLMTALQMQHDRTKTQKIPVRKGKPGH